MAGKTLSQNSKIKTPMITYRLQAEQVWIQVCPGPGRGAVFRWHTYRSKVLPAPGITPTVLISQMRKCSSNFADTTSSWLELSYVGKDEKNKFKPGINSEILEIGCSGFAF